MRSDKKGKKSRRWLKVTGIVCLLLLIGAGAYAYSIFHSLTSAGNMKVVFNPYTNFPCQPLILSVR